MERFENLNWTSQHEIKIVNNFSSGTRDSYIHFSVPFFASLQNSNQIHARHWNSSTLSTSPAACNDQTWEQYRDSSSSLISLGFLEAFLFFRLFIPRVLAFLSYISFTTCRNFFVIICAESRREVLQKLRKNCWSWKEENRGERIK